MIEKLDKPVHYAFIALRAAARGAGKLAAYAARHVLPAAIRLGKNAFEKTSQMKAETRAAYRQRRYNRAHA